MFRGYNPFCAVNIIHDRLFIEYAKTDMTTYLNRRGCIFCDGEPLEQMPLYHMLGEKDNTYWVEANGQTVHFRLKGDADPADHRIEVTVREQCFAPRKPFVSYIQVKGLICEHAATGAPVPQRGAISSFRGHHWLDCGNENTRITSNLFLNGIIISFMTAKKPRSFFRQWTMSRKAICSSA